MSYENGSLQNRHHENGFSLPIQRDEWSKEEFETLQKTICKDLNSSEMKLFAGVCKRTKLDPFAKQIYAIKRGKGTPKESVTFQTSIDGYRIIANRCSEYEGQEDTVWFDDTGKEFTIWTQRRPPYAARVGVFRAGYKFPIRCIAIYSEYKVDSNPLWQKMPSIMIAKCAEALTLRKAFPNELSGIYTSEEMTQADDHKKDFVPTYSRAPSQVAPLPIPVPVAAPIAIEAPAIPDEVQDKNKAIKDKIISGIMRLTDDGKNKEVLGELLERLGITSSREVMECDNEQVLLDWDTIVA